MEIHALAARGWSVSAISRNTGRDRKTVRKYLAAPRGALLGRERAPSCLEPFRAYIEAHFEDDAHLEAAVLYRELVDAGFARSYPTLLRELRRLELRPVCVVCQHRRGDAVTVEIEHPPGEEIQWDWLGAVAGEMLRVLAGGAVGVQPAADPVKRIMVNVGSAPRAPSRWWRPGKARCRLTGAGRGGVRVVVRGRESRPHGEGGQQDRGMRRRSGGRA